MAVDVLQILGVMIAQQQQPPPQPPPQPYPHVQQYAPLSQGNV